MENYKQIHLQKLSTAATADRYLLACNGRYYEAGAGVAELLACLQTHATETEAVEAYVEQKQGRVSATQVEAFIGERLRPMLSEEAQPQKRTFLYERELFSAKMVDGFSDRFRFLFNGVWMALLMTCVVAADVWFFCTTDDLLVFNNAANAYTVVGLLVFMVVSSLFHELGHAAACKRFGIRHGGIGFGLYLNFPVLYTDVTEVWKLGRRQRCVVNLAGVYFQLYFLAVLLALFYATGNDIVRYLILTLNLGFVMTLNPFFKFDGYWLASDILGVPNLRTRSKEVIAYFFRKWRGKPAGAKPYFNVLLMHFNQVDFMNKIIVAFLISIFFAFSAQAQVLKGKVCDKEQGNISYASIRLLTQDSVFVKGEVTNEKGGFLLTDIKSGNYILVVSCVGYKNSYSNLKMPDADYELSTIWLEDDDVLLSEVTVSGSSIIYKRDRTLIIPDMQQRKHAYSGYDLLYNLMIPGIDVDTRKGTVSNERGAVTVYINGVRADMREVQNLRPKDIEKVEYYDMPSGIYTGDIASLNYITKTYKAGGYIALDGEQTLGYTAGDYNIGAKLVKGKTSYTFFGGYNMSKYDGTEEEKNEIIHFPEEVVHRDRSTENAFYKNNQQYAQFKVNYAEEKYNLFAQAALTRDDTPRSGRDEALRYSSDASQNVNASNWTEEENLKPSLCLDGLFYPTKAQRIHIRAIGSYSDNTYRRNYAEDERLSRTHVNEDYYSFNLLGVYGINLKNSTLGASVMHDHHITSSTYMGDYDSWQHLWRGETIVYLSYMQHLMNDKWTFLLYPGVSLLNYRLHSQALQRYWTFRTNSWIRYQPNKNHQLLGGFAMGNNQPDISSMNDMDQTVDFLQIKRGNPYLDNPVIQEFFFTYNAKLNPVNLKLNLWSTILKHNIRSAYFIEGDKLVNTFRSDATYRKWKAELSASCRISDNLRANGKLRYEKFEYPSLPGVETDNFFASLDMDYYFKSFTLRGWVKSTERTLDDSSLAIAKSPCTYGFSLRYNASNWMAEVGTANPFNAHSHYREYLYTDVYQYNQVRTSRIYQQTGYIKVAYTFDFGKKTSKERNNVDRSIHSAILKAD